MNAKHHPSRRALVIGVLTALAAVAAWGAVSFIKASAGTEPVGANAGSTTDSHGIHLFEATRPSPHRPDTIKRGDADALAAYQTATPVGAVMALPASGDPVRGTFSPVIGWPLIGIHAVLTPDGRVLTYGTPEAGTKSGYFIYDVWDPQLGLGPDSHTVLPNNTAVDLFCNAQLLLPTGNIEMWGGDVTDLSTGRSMLLANDDSNVFNPLDNSLSLSGKMHRKRWYATATTLPNGEVYIQGGTGGTNAPEGDTGGKDFPEVRTATGQFRLLTGASTFYIAALYPRNFLAPDGNIFGMHYEQMYRVDPSGPGAIIRAGKFTSTNLGPTSTAVMFRPGKILQVGGGKDPALASLEAHVVDINPAIPTISAVASPRYRRHWANATVLPDGRVFLSGGSTADNSAASGVAYTSELYDPETNTWSDGATAQQMRLYHSTSLLLPDASVLTLGGGALGPERNLNAEIYYPPYLFQADGTPAPRPVIASLPMTANPASTLRIGTPVPASITRVTMVKTGSNTHSLDMDQRFLELPFTIVGGELEATLPSNPFETPPGFYMVFLINDQGVPSEAAMVRINVLGATPLRFADFDGDGKSDLLWRNTSNGSNAIWRSANNVTQQPITGVSNQGWKVVGAGDFDGDGKSDIFWRNDSNGANAIWRSGSHTTQLPVIGVSNRSWKVVGVGDFDGDGSADTFWRNASTGANAIWKSGNYTTQHPVVGVNNLNWAVAGIGDFDGDGLSDVLWRNASTGVNTVWRSANASLPLAVARVNNPSWLIVGIGDFDGDRRSDVFWRNSSSGANTIWKSANATTQQAVTTLSDQAWKLEAAGDYDGDGKSDAIWRNQRTGANARWQSGNSASSQAITGVSNPAWTIVP